MNNTDITNKIDLIQSMYNAVLDLTASVNRISEKVNMIDEKQKDLYRIIETHPSQWNDADKEISSITNVIGSKMGDSIEKVNNKLIDQSKQCAGRFNRIEKMYSKMMGAYMVISMVFGVLISHFMKGCN